MEAGFFVNKKDGRKSFLSAATIKIIGANKILKDWYQVGQPLPDEDLIHPETAITPEEIKKVEGRLSINKLRNAVADMDMDELVGYLDDDRSTAVSIAEAELKRRSEDVDSE